MANPKISDPGDSVLRFASISLFVMSLVTFAMVVGFVLTLLLTAI